MNRRRGQGRKALLRKAAAVLIVEIIVLIVILTLTPRTSEIDAVLVTSRVTAPFLPSAPNATRNEKAGFLQNLRAAELVIQSFSSVDVERGSLSIWDDARRAWRSVTAGAPIHIDAEPPLGKIIFERVTLKRLVFGDADKQGTLLLEARPHQGSSMLIVAIDDRASELVLGESDEMIATCQLCRIRGVTDPAARPPFVLKLRIGNLSTGEINIKSLGTRLVLDIFPGADGLGAEYLRIRRPGLCDGEPPELLPRVAGTVTFLDVNRKEPVPENSTVNIDAADPLSIDGLTLVKTDSKPPRDAIQLHMTGRAQRVSFSRDCASEGESRQPSWLEYLQHRPLFLALGAAAAALASLVAAFTSVRSFFDA